MMKRGFMISQYAHQTHARAANRDTHFLPVYGRVQCDNNNKNKQRQLTNAMVGTPCTVCTLIGRRLGRIARIPRQRAGIEYDNGYIKKRKTRIIGFNAIVTTIRRRPSLRFDSDVLTTLRDGTTVNYMSRPCITVEITTKNVFYLVCVSQIRSPRAIRVTWWTMFLCVTRQTATPGDSSSYLA